MTRERKYATGINWTGQIQIDFLVKCIIHVIFAEQRQIYRRILIFDLHGAVLQEGAWGRGRGDIDTIQVWDMKVNIT